MKRFIAFFLALTLAFGLCACDGNNRSPQDRLKGSWSGHISMNALLALCHQQISATIGFGDLSCLTGSLSSDLAVSFLLIFDGNGTAIVYLNKAHFNSRMQELAEHLLTQDMLLQVIGLENALPEEIDIALGGLSMEQLITILQLQMQSADFADTLAQQYHYETSGDYLVIPVTDNYQIDGDRVLINNSYLRFYDADLLLPENGDLAPDNLNLDAAPLTFTRINDKTDY